MSVQVEVSVRPLDLVCLRFDADEKRTFFVGVFGDVVIPQVLQVVDQLVRQHRFLLLLREIQANPDMIGITKIKESRNGAVVEWIIRTFYDRELASWYELSNRKYAGHIEIAQAGHSIHHTTH
jgi:hypothetical protein